MVNWENILKMLLESAPVVLSLLVLAGVLLTVLYIVIKVVVPALRETVQMFEVQRASWKSLIDEQNKLHSRLVTEFEERIVELETEVGILRKEDVSKSARIAELESELEKLRQERVCQEARIAELESELKKVRSERDELRARIKTLESVTKERQEKELTKEDSDVTGDGKPKSNG